MFCFLMKKIKNSSIFIVIWIICTAQIIQIEKDSLLLAKELDHLEEYYKHNFDSTLIYANKLELKASCLKNEEIKFQALLYKAKAYNKLGKKDSALFVLDNLLSQTANMSNRFLKLKYIQLGLKYILQTTILTTHRKI